MPKAVEGSLGDEVLEYLKTQVVRRRLFPRAVLTGLVAGGLAVAFRASLDGASRLRETVVAQWHLPVWSATLLVFAIATVATYFSLLIGRIEPAAKGSGIPHMKAIMEGHATMDWARIVLVKFAAAVLSIGAGLGLGREGPTVQMGGAAGMAVANLTGSDPRERRALMASGGGAGLAAAFNAPLAGVTFVLEELQRDFQPVVFSASLLCAAVATVVSRWVSGQVPVFTVPPIPPVNLAFTPIFVVLGVVGGFFGVAFNRALLHTTASMARLRSRSLPLVALLTGAAVAGAYALSPLLLGGGHELSEKALMGSLGLGISVAFLLARFALIHLSYGSGVAGGIFAPILSLGALTGLIVFQVTGYLLPTQGLPVAACAVAGMCAMFSGVVRAPLTGVILIGEMTGSYDLLLPLLIAAFSSYAIAEGLRDTPIYEALLQRDAATKGGVADDAEPRIVELEIRPESPLSGKALRELRLPEGVLIVQCRAAGRQFVPRGSTVLHEHMRIVVSVSNGEKLRVIQELAAP